MDEITPEELKKKSVFVQLAFEDAQKRANEYIDFHDFLFKDRKMYRTRMFPNGVHVERQSSTDQKWYTSKVFYLGER